MKRKIFFLLFLFAISLAISFCDSKPKNIILFIGDGMGLTPITAALYNNKSLNIEEFSTIGLVKTDSISEANNITDSAAAGTAIACGEKTLNGYTGMAVDGKKLESVLEIAQKLNMSTGIVVTCSLTHATPAAFYAHTLSRKDEMEIARQCAQKNIDVLFGGGLKYFIKDNLIEKMKKDGYVYIKNEEELKSKKYVKTEKLLGIFADEAMPEVVTRKPVLKDMVSKALELLSSNTNGFFLMVEGSQIDWMLHENNAEKANRELKDFDEAIQIAMEYKKSNNSTLILVTADHDTGASYIPLINLKNNIISLKFASKDHTGTMVPLFAKGPGEQFFSGIYSNTKIATIIKYLLQK